MPWSPGSMSEPSCSQGSWGTNPPELLQFLPDLNLRSCHLSFLGMVADLTSPWGLGSSNRASRPQDLPCHMVTALLRDQDKVLLLAPFFSHGIMQESLVITPGNVVLPPGPRQWFLSRGTWPSSAVGGCRSSEFCMIPSSSPPETDTGGQRSVMLSSSHCTFAEHLRYHCSLDGGSCLTVVVLGHESLTNPLGLFWFSILSLTLFRSIFALFGLSFYLLFKSSFGTSQHGEKVQCVGKKGECYFLGTFLLTFLNLASSFIYALVAQMLEGPAILLPLSLF